MSKVRVIKKDEQQQQQRIRPEVRKRLLQDERRELLARVSKIDRELQKV